MGMDLDLVKRSLLAELESLDGLRGDELKEEISRAKAKVDVANQINSYVANQIAVTRLVVNTRGQTSKSINRAVDRLLGPADSSGDGTDPSNGTATPRLPAT